MAIRGVSFAETSEFILTRDPGHPDNVNAEVERRIKAATAGSKTKLNDSKEAEIRAEVTKDPDFQPTVFLIGNLTKADKIRLGDLTTAPTMHGSSITMTTRRTERAYEAVTRGLKGWKNFQDAEGKDVPYKETTVPDGMGGFGRVVDEDGLRHIETRDIHELAAEVLRVNGMGEQQMGNSEGASPLSAEALSGIGAATDAHQSNNESEDA